MDYKNNKNDDIIRYRINGEGAKGSAEALEVLWKVQNIK